MDERLRNQLLRRLRDGLDLQRLGRTNSETAREEVLVLIRSSVNSEAVPLSFAERERLAREILDEIFGFGPLEQLLEDSTVSEILVRGFDRVYVRHGGKIKLTGRSFNDNRHLLKIIERILSRVGRHINGSSPLAEVLLGDGSCVNAIIPPLALYPCLSIQRFRGSAGTFRTH